MKKNYFLAQILLIISVLFVFSCQSETKKSKHPKYIFYLIGDGMGLAQISATEAYLSELEGKVGGVNLPFTQFPASGFITTFSANRGITCSSAAGTALAIGTKTRNTMLGLAPDSTQLKSIAIKFKEAGYKVGITTSVGVNHATPAAFYGHQTNRNNHYEIGLELPATNFDFFAGASMLDHKGKEKDKKSLYDIIEENGYGVARGIHQYDSVLNISNKILWVEKPDTLEALSYAIDRKGGELTLPVIVEKAIEFLSKDNDKGFFLMIEGGEIDWSCHSNDAGTTIHEVMDFSAAIDKVIEFYNAHPDETLIVITADHETGGFSLAHTEGYKLNTQIYQHQKISKWVLSDYFHKLSAEKKQDVKWEEIKDILTEKLGFWKEIEINADNEKRLKDCYIEAFIKGHDVEEKNLYATTGAMANLAFKILNETAKTSWTTSSHSGIPVPIFAKGMGSEEFIGKMDNTDVPKKIMKIAGVEF